MKADTSEFISSLLSFKAAWNSLLSLSVLFLSCRALIVWDYGANDDWRSVDYM